MNRTHAPVPSCLAVHFASNRDASFAALVRSLWSVVFLIVSATFASDAYAAQKYSLTDLGPLGGNDAHSINDNGQVVGYKDFGSGYRGFLYSGGTTTNLGTLSPGHAASFAIAINNAGQVVGNSRQTSTSGPSWAFIYSGGVNDEGSGPRRQRL